jgi:hypothetical protein
MLRSAFELEAAGRVDALAGQPAGCVGGEVWCLAFLIRFDRLHRFERELGGVLLLGCFAAGVCCAEADQCRGGEEDA